MVDERPTELKDAVARGNEVGRFLENRVVQAVMQGLELAYYEAWKAAPTPAERETIFARVSAFDDLQAALKGVVESGDLATHELELLARDTD